MARKLEPDTLRIFLAPMDGLLDFVLRDMLTRCGGVDVCVTEFVRVSGSALPKRSFQRIAPELLAGSLTPAGVPVRVQLLGSDPHFMALNAHRLATLAPAGIDPNFGCPAKTVNRHQGGAILLREPERIRRLVQAVREAFSARASAVGKNALGLCRQKLGGCLRLGHARRRRARIGRPRPHQDRRLPPTRPLGLGRPDTGRSHHPGDRQWRDMDCGRLSALASKSAGSAT